MGMFNNMLKNNESLFLNPIALDYDYQPKMVPYREIQQKQIANSIKPLFNGMNGRNILIHGKPGVGKTVATNSILNELEDETDEIIPIYTNCWQKNTFYKIALHLCEELGYKLTHNKKSDELFAIAAAIINKKSAVLLFDEVDKLDDVDILYIIIEKIYRKSIILITNFKEWIENLDIRVKSRLTPEIMYFPPYNQDQIKGILEQRSKYAFVENVLDGAALSLIAEKTYGIRDVRVGLHLMKESGLAAEERASRKIEVEDVNTAMGRLHEFSINQAVELPEDTQNVLAIVKKHSGLKIGDLFKKYEELGATRSYKSFQRDIKKLEKGKFVKLEKLTGDGGNSTIIKYIGAEVKKLTDF